VLNIFRFVVCVFVVGVVRVGARAVEDEITASYGTTEASVFEIDPIVVCGWPLTDFEGYIYLKELSGNDVNVRVVSVVGSIEVDEVSLSPMTANSSKSVVISKPVKHRVYVSSSAEGSIVIAYRVICYGGG